MLPLKLAGTVAARKGLPLAGVVTDAVVGAVLSRVKLTVVPLKELPALSVVVAWMVNVVSASAPQMGMGALLVLVATALPAVTLFVAARLKMVDCQVAPF